ncbi:hypothetical protein [Streptomyces litchfieldiae]|uniref:Integral membrane protein n=1 Tax=Streptomyces litchfieldiae TaxID=3075543 RepID=A0ABU2MWN1_9ACTN|nr:hypothetical protein [Streptomyces sp. DSM 44938]MDT0346009.1 hypothetical protein [Streptomyces sp. DSM 44938]
MSGTTTAPPARRIPLLVLGLTALLALMLTAFVLPAVNSGPHDVPIAVAGPREAAEELADRIDEAQPGAFDVRLLADADAARQAMGDRDIYGAVVVGGPRPELLVAGAASTQIANTLRGLTPSLAGSAAEPAVPVTDLYPTTDDDPLGTGLSAGALPLVLGGYLAAMAISMAVARPRQRAVAAFGFAVVAGFALSALLRYGFGVIGGDYPLTALALTFVLAATCWGIIGLRGVLGAPGLGLGAALMVLVGNPLSGLSGGPEWLPAGWGAFGQYLPPGAGGSLLRSVSFFDGAGSGPHLAVLTCWLVGGILLFLIGVRRERAAGKGAGPDAAEPAAPASAAAA